MVVVRVNIKVRKYLWSEVVGDVNNVLHGIIKYANAHTKQYFIRSIFFLPPQVESFLKHTVLNVTILTIGFVVLLFAVVILITLVLLSG